MMDAMREKGLRRIRDLASSTANKVRTQPATRNSPKRPRSAIRDCATTAGQDSLTADSQNFSWEEMMCPDSR